MAKPLVWALGGTALFVAVVGYTTGRRAPANVEPVASAAPPVIAPEPPPQVLSATVSVAHFVKDTLNECVDMTLSDQGPGARAAVRSFTEPGATNVSKDGSAMRLQKPCTEQFADRLTLATCTKSGRPDAGTATVTITVRHYEYASVYESDQEMKDCLEIGGEWKALPKDSREVARAGLHKHLVEAKKAAEELRNAGNK